MHLSLNDHFLRSLEIKCKLAAEAGWHGVWIKKYDFRFHKIWQVSHTTVQLQPAVMAGRYFQFYSSKISSVL